MAITRRFQAKTTVPPAVHSQLVTGLATLRKQGIEILSHTANPDGSVTVVFCGRGLGKKAIPVPPPCTVAIANGQITIQPIE